MRTMNSVAGLVLIAALVAGGCGKSGDPATPDAGVDGGADAGPSADELLDEFFALAVHEIEIEVDATGVDSLLAAPKVYTQANVTIDGTALDDVGVRLKGSPRFSRS